MKFINKFIFLFIVFFSLFSCTNNLNNGNVSFYSAYKPILMDRSELEQSIYLMQEREIDTIFKVGFLADLILLGEIYYGIHILDNSIPTNFRYLGFINIPGIIDFVVKDSMIYANNSVDLIAIKLVSPEQIVLTQREKNVFPELSPPDGRKPNPIFMRSQRLENTEIIAWVRDKNIDLLDSLFIVNNLLSVFNDYLLGIIGQNLVVYKIQDDLLEYKSFTRVNIDVNYKLFSVDQYFMCIGLSSLRVLSLELDNPILKKEYFGISPANYIDFRKFSESYYMLVSFHYDPFYWNTTNQVEIYNLGNFNTISLDTIIKLNYPLDVKIKDSLFFVCDQGIKIFKLDSSYNQIYYQPADAYNLFLKDSLLITIGSNLTQYQLVQDSLILLWQKSIKFSWVMH